MSHFAARTPFWFASVNRLAIVLSALSLIVFFGALFHARVQIGNSRDSYELASTKVQGGKNQTISHFEDLTFLTTREQAISDWRSAGKFGPADEMIWVETLLKISAQVDARDFRYQIAESQRIESLFGDAIKRVAVSRSDIRVDFEVNHGASAFRFFTEFQKEALGLFTISEFSLERIDLESSNQTVRSVPIEVERTMSRKSDGALQPEGTGDKTMDSDFGGVKVAATLSWLSIDPASRI